MDDLVRSNEISDPVKESIMQCFDQQIFENFNTMKPHSKPAKITGHCSKYNNVEEIWRFTLEKMEIKDDQQNFKESSDLCLLFSMNAKNNPVEQLP